MKKKLMQYQLSELPNLGPASERMLNAIGIFTPEQLAESDPVDIYIKMKSHNINASINIIYAIYGALNTIHWTRIPKEQRASLLHQLDAALHKQKNHKHAEA